jgi:hypothetical protein
MITLAQYYGESLHLDEYKHLKLISGIILDDRSFQVMKNKPFRLVEPDNKVTIVVKENSLYGSIYRKLDVDN